MPRPYQTRHDAKHLAGLALIFLALLLGLFLPLMASAQARPLILSAQQQTNPNSTGKADKDIRVLEPGKPIERDLTGGELHSYRIMLTAGQYMHVAVDQRGIDLVVTAFGPDGKKLAEVDSPNGTQGPEPVSMIVEATGNHRLEVRSLEKTAAAGRYEVKIEELRTATGQDKSRIVAEQAFMQANLLRGQGTAESLKSAIKKYEESLPLFRAVGDRNREAMILLGVGEVYYSLGERQKALDFFNQSLPLNRAVGDRSGEATTLNNIGGVYDSLGEKQKALEYFTQALPISRAVGNRSVEAATLNNIGGVYNSLGEKQKALECFTQALPILRAVGDRSLEAATLNNIGAVYNSLGEKQKALEYFTQALPILRAVGNRSVEAATLNNIGAVYNSLGEKQKALEYSTQALPILRAVGNRSGEATTLNNIGGVYDSLGEKQKALEYYNQALPISRAVGDRSGEAAMLNNIGVVYDSLGEKQKALEYFNQALPISRAVGDRSGEATTLHNIGRVYYSLGEKQKALEYYNQALPILRAVGDRSVEATTLRNLMFLWKDSNASVAVLYGKQSINVYQQLRGNITGLEEEVQRTFLHSVEDTYRILADLLITQGRLPEVQQVLGMLKEEEYFEFIRRDNKEASALNGRAALTPKEADWEKRYREIADQLTILGRERGELLAKQSRTPNEDQRLSKLEADLRFSQEAFQKFLDQLFIEFGKSEIAKERVFQLQESQALMEDLRELGSGAVALYTLVGEEKYRVILVTPDVQRAYEYPIKAADLSHKVLAYREVLENPQLDPLPVAKELYQILIGPVAKDLKDARARTLMWSLDGVLRYIPIAALHDGEKYMVERYRNVVFTPASNSRLKDLPSAKWRGLGLGVSKRIGRASALPAVPEELRGIIRGPGVGSATGGVMAGKVLLDEAFTEEAMKLELRQRYPVVHIASHFQFQPGNETDSFLLLGDGKRLSLAEIKTSVNLFGGVELLTLSACNTATGGAGADGKEVEGFGVLAQRQGAKAIVASLWPVADTSTRHLMEKFYRVRNAQIGTSKAEALRQAQLSLLIGEAKASGAGARERGITLGAGRNRENSETGEKRRGVAVIGASKNKGPYSHPYFWAPFIMIGNWR